MLIYWRHFPQTPDTNKPVKMQPCLTAAIRNELNISHMNLPAECKSANSKHQHIALILVRLCVCVQVGVCMHECVYVQCGCVCIQVSAGTFASAFLQTFRHSAALSDSPV